MISIATLTGESLDQMNSIANAPKILATLVGKGGDFRNGHGPDGVPVMPQVRGRVQGLPFAVVLCKKFAQRQLSRLERTSNNQVVGQ